MEDKNELDYSVEQKEELMKLEYELQRFSLASAILEQRLRIKQLTELLNQKPTDQEKTQPERIKRKVEDY